MAKLQELDLDFKRYPLDSNEGFICDIHKQHYSESIMIWLIKCVCFILFANKISGQQGVKQIHSRYINNARDALIEKLVEDVKNLTLEIQLLKDAASQTNFVGEEKNATFEEHEVSGHNGNDASSGELNDEATVETEAEEVINKNLQQNGKI